MKKSLKKIVSLSFLFLLALSCTKDVGLITEVEFRLLEEHARDGFVNQGLRTALTIVPEAEMDGLEYTFSYEVLRGKGYFEDADGIPWEAGKGLPVTAPLTTSVLYVGTEPGEHRLRIVATDDFGFTEELEITYGLKNVPALWEATSESTVIELGKEAEILLLLDISDAISGLTYEARYEFASGAGTISPLETGGQAIGGEYSPMTTGTHPFVFTPSELGSQQIVFVLRDSNGQELKTEIVFDVLEDIKVITIFLGDDDAITMQLGDEIAPDITFDPPNATDQGFTLVSSDPDVVLIDGNNVCIAVGPGTAIVTVTSVSNPEVTDTVTVTVVGEIGIPVTSIVISQEDPNATGAVRQLIATVLPSDATDPSVIWSTDDETIATISEDGLLTGLSAGDVTITATSVSDPEINDTIIVEITGGAVQNDTDITAFELPGQNSSVLDPENHIITVNVTDGTELNVSPSALSISGNATIVPGIEQVHDFNNSIEYTVTGGDGSEQVWTVNVTVSPAEGSSANDILTFTVPGQIGASTIDTESATIGITIAQGTDISSLVPDQVTLSANAVLSPLATQAQDFTQPFTYIVTAENGVERSWIINVTEFSSEESDQNAITDFALPVQNDIDLDEVNAIITVNVPDGTDLNDIVPSVLDISADATVSPSTGVLQDFNGAVEYTVTAENGTPRKWTVNTTVAANIAPTAVGDAVGLEIGETITIDVLANDSDPDTLDSELTITDISAPSPPGYGNAVINGRQIDFTSNGRAGEPEEVTFTYTINDGNPGNDATATVTVQLAINEVLVTSVTLDPTDLTLEAGQSRTVNTDIAPGNATNAGLTWISDNETVATVSGTGEVTAVAQGSAVISVSTNDASDITETVNITVDLTTISVTGVTVDPTAITIIDGNNTTLNPTVSPGNASNRNITWTSDSPGIASVNNGVVTGESPGTATITVTTEDGGFTATSTIRVNPVTISVTGVTIDPTVITIIDGNNTTLNPTVLPGNASNRNITWTSDSPGIASVNNGVVTGESPGPATITVTTVDGGYTATARITVQAATVPLTLTSVTLDYNVTNKTINYISGSELPLHTDYVRDELSTMELVLTNVVSSSSNIRFIYIDGVRYNYNATGVGWAINGHILVNKSVAHNKLFSIPQLIEYETDYTDNNLLNYRKSTNANPVSIDIQIEDNNGTLSNIIQVNSPSTYGFETEVITSPTVPITGLYPITSLVSIDGINQLGVIFGISRWVYF